MRAVDDPARASIGLRAAEPGAAIECGAVVECADVGNDEARNDAARNDAARNDAARNDEARNDEARNDEARNDEGERAERAEHADRVDVPDAEARSFDVRRAIVVRPVEPDDFAAWQLLWDGYNAFYGRAGATALAPATTLETWRRFLDPAEPVFASVAEVGAKVAGLVHVLYHRSTTRIEPVCYLQDLFTAENARGRGVGRALIEAVYRQAAAAGIGRVYWHTQSSNAAARALYDSLARHAGFIVYAHEG